VLRVSVVIPALNEEACIQQAVEGAWDCGAWEVILADGGSRDRTLLLAERCGAEVLSAPRGRASQQNAGAARARGELLLFLHADNWLPRNAAEQITQACGDQAVLVGAFRQRIEATGRLYRMLESGNAWRARRLGIPYGDQGIFVRRDLFHRVGGFPDVPLMEDFLLMKRLRRFTRPVLLPGPLHVSARRWQRYGILRQTLRNWALVAAASLGVSPHRLASFYPRHCEESEAKERRC